MSPNLWSHFFVWTLLDNSFITWIIVCVNPNNLLKLEKIVRLDSSEINLIPCIDDELYLYLLPILNNLNIDDALPTQLKVVFTALKLEFYINEFIKNRPHLFSSDSNFLEIVTNVFSKFSFNFTPLIYSLEGSYSFKIALTYIDNLFDDINTSEFFSHMSMEFKEMLLKRLLQSEVSYIFSSTFCMKFFAHIQGDEFSSDELSTYSSFFHSDGSLNYASVLKSGKSLEVFLVTTVCTSYQYKIDRNFLLFLKLLSDSRSPFKDFTEFSNLQTKHQKAMSQYSLDDVVEFVLEQSPQLLIEGGDDYIFYILQDSFCLSINDQIRLRNYDFILNWFIILLSSSSFSDELIVKMSLLLNDKVLKNSSLVKIVFFIIVQAFDDPYLANVIEVALSSSDMSSNRGVYRVCKFLNKLYYLYNSSNLSNFPNLDLVKLGTEFSIDSIDDFFDTFLANEVIGDFSISDPLIIEKFLEIRSQLLQLYCFYSSPKVKPYSELVSDGVISYVGELCTQRDIDTPITDSLPCNVMQPFLDNTTFAFSDSLIISECDDFFEILRMGIEPKVTCYSCFNGAFRENILPVLFLKDRKYLRLYRDSSFYARAVLRFVSFDFKLSAYPEHCNVAGLTIDNFSGRSSDLKYFLSFLCFKSFECGVHLVVHSTFFSDLRPALESYNFDSVNPVNVDHKPENIFDLHYTDNSNSLNGDFMAIFLDSRKENV